VAGIYYGKGRLWHTISYNLHPVTGQSAYQFSDVAAYDALGRPTSLGQWFMKSDGQYAVYSLARAYDLAGHVTWENYPSSQNYPSQHTVSYSYGADGRLSGFTGYLGDGVPRTYADQMSYNAAGQMLSEHFGTSSALYHRKHYNNRHQLYDIRLGTGTVDNLNDPATKNRGALHLFYNTAYAFGDGAAGNNGNVYRADHVVPLDESVSNWVDSVSYYSYDDLNRLTAVDELPVASWVGGGNIGWLPQAYAQRYNYDRWGNRTLNTVATWGIGINRKAFTAKTANNRLVELPGDTGEETSGNSMRYDKAGNLIFDSYTGVGTRVYDAENRMTSAVGVGNNMSYYVYDGDGRRVRRVVWEGGMQKEYWQVYGFDGELVAEYLANGLPGTPSKEYGYRGGQLLVVVPCDSAIRWLVTDQLGTPRMEVDGTGSLSGMKRHDYLPFGEELFAGMGVRSEGNGYTADCVRQRYSGKERDDETNLDYMGARYYSGAQGRFISPDPLSHWMPEDKQRQEFSSNPQRWNKYTYVLNNPLKYTDPTGLAEIPLGDDLSAELRADLEKRLGQDAKNIWNKVLDNNKRQLALNARAQLIALGVWDNVTSIGFARYSVSPKEFRAMNYSIDNSGGWEFAFTTNKDIRPTLEKQGFYSQESGHPEAVWQLKQPEQEGTDVVAHFLGVRQPYDKYTDFHFDRGGGGFTLSHAWDVLMLTLMGIRGR
jgi:RHS repeat-associated protein